MSDDPDTPAPQPLEYQTPAKYRPMRPSGEVEPRRPGRFVEALVGFVAYAFGCGVVYTIGDLTGFNSMPTMAWILIVLTLFTTVVVDQVWHWHGFGIGVLVGFLASCLIGAVYVLPSFGGFAP